MEIEKEREDDNAKKKYFRAFCRTNYRAVYSLGNETIYFFNLKYHSVYYAQHIPHKEGTEPDLVMLVEDMGWIHTPEIDGIRYDNDRTNAIMNKCYYKY